MPSNQARLSFDVSGAKNFKPADFIYGLADVISPLMRNTSYENSIGLLREVNSGLMLRKLVEFDMFPPETLSIENYASGLKSLCGACGQQNGKCGNIKYVSKNASYRLNVPQKQNAEDCMQKVDAKNGLSLCPKSVLNVRWEHWKTIASILDVSYMDAVPEIKAIGDTLKDIIINNYNIQPSPEK